VIRNIERVVWPADVMTGVRPLFTGDYAREGSRAEFEVLRSDRDGNPAERSDRVKEAAAELTAETDPVLDLLPRLGPQGLGVDADPMQARAAEMLFRTQKISVLEDGADVLGDGELAEDRRLLRQVGEAAARAPVDARTRQPMGILHGGISVLLAESLGSCGAAFSSPPDYRAVGLEINANHLRSVKEGWVVGVGRPFHVGRTTQVWHIELSNDKGQLTCVSRITIALLAPEA
jgi:uncharacterized protein (TIGR00369 family)